MPQSSRNTRGPGSAAFRAAWAYFSRTATLISVVLIFALPWHNTSLCGRQWLITDLVPSSFRSMRAPFAKRSPFTTAADRSRGSTRTSSSDSLPFAVGLSISLASSSRSGINFLMYRCVLARSSTKSPNTPRLRAPRARSAYHEVVAVIGSAYCGLISIAFL
jgi:hypothetical protein